MKHLFLSFLITFTAISVFSQETISVPAQCYNLSNNQFVCNTTVTMRMARDTYGPLMVIEVKPYPQEQYGLLYCFNQSRDCNSTFQTIVVGNEAGWIATTKMSDFPESERQHIALFESPNNGHRLYFFKKNSPYGEPNYLHGCYLKLSAKDEWSLRRFFVETGNKYNIFRYLDPIKE